MSPLADAWLARHRARLDAAVAAYHSREAYTPFVESPSRKHHPEGAHARGRAAFESHLGHAFDLPGHPCAAWSGDEISPYTGRPLGVTYPRPAVEPLFEAIRAGWDPWRLASPSRRVGVCLEILDRWAAAAFENTYATMHTAGQGFMLAFAGSGASALDRGLEGLTAAWVAMQQMPSEATYTRRFGGAPVTLRKRYRLMPVGVAVVFSCGSYPAWNAWPAVLANLATGNPVILKPHPDCVLPMAIGARVARAALAEAGFDRNLLTLAPDTWADPIAEPLLSHPDTAIVDFTGGQRFGGWIETHCPRLQVYTETAGCNAVLLESVTSLDPVLDAIAHGICLFSSQMCTAPQNIWIPKAGVRTAEGVVPFDAVIAHLVERIDRLLADPARAAAICGAIHSPKTLAEMASLAEAAGDRCIRRGGPYPHPDFPEARTATPLLARLDAADRALAQRERFGPMAFVIAAPDRDAALAGAASDARRFGAIASYAYTTDPAWQARLEETFALAGASVGINLVGQRPINFTAAFSDYHVTGLNPAGTACLTDPAFVARRFRVVQSKVEVAPVVDPSTDR